MARSPYTRFEERRSSINCNNILLNLQMLFIIDNKNW